MISTLIKKDGSAFQLASSHLILALPRRLIEVHIAFSPSPDIRTLQRWKKIPTWMAPHAKFFAVYPRPFWREAGLSGSAQSMAEPLVEIHDATTSSGEAALMGFIGIPPAPVNSTSAEPADSAKNMRLAKIS